MAMEPHRIKIIECPRDAMQGWKNFIPTEKKIEYINALLQVGFDTIDFGSFVSAKAIPQMADTAQVLKGLRMEKTTSKLLAIIANTRGAQDAVVHETIKYLGFPFSVSETFQQRNTNSSIEQSLKTVEEIQELCIKNNKQLVIYISMGFGNPYGDPYSEEIVYKWAYDLSQMGIKIISLADTVGMATGEQINAMTKYLIATLPETEIGVHLHSATHNRKEKLQAAIDAACMRYDGAMKGIGGCPMANDELVGNMDTEWLYDYLQKYFIAPRLDDEALARCSRLATEIFI
ncbi:MAG TPA: hydroxymethylglutaryl-CoA lyase [Chitinophagaceae bacterium]